MDGVIDWREVVWKSHAHQSVDNFLHCRSLIGRCAHKKINFSTERPSELILPVQINSTHFINLANFVMPTINLSDDYQLLGLSLANVPSLSASLINLTNVLRLNGNFLIPNSSICLVCSISAGGRVFFSVMRSWNILLKTVIALFTLVVVVLIFKHQVGDIPPYRLSPTNG